MAPTFSSGCDSCAHLAVKIAELEGRISTLYQIREAELLMDTITFGPTQTDSICPSVSGSSASGPDVTPVAAEATAPPAPAAAAAANPPDTAADNSWIGHEAKRKVPISSTPSVPQPWSQVTVRRKGGYSPRAPRYNIQLENKFAPLGSPTAHEEPQHPSPSPPPRRSHSSPSLQMPPPAKHDCPSHSRTRRSIPMFTPAPRRAFAPRSIHPILATSPPRVKSPPPITAPTSLNHEIPHTNSTSPRPLFPLTTLIVGDSITRGIRFFNAITHCFPGATTPAILGKLPDLLHTLPSSIHRIIVHVGTNDCSKRHSEVTKTEFRELLLFLNSCGKSIFISGPLSPHGCGSEKFSRVLYFHTWLQSLCRAHNLVFIDNFNLFWNRQSFFKSDGIHPNKLGTHILKTNLQHAVHYSVYDCL